MKKYLINVRLICAMMLICGMLVTFASAEPVTKAQASRFGKELEDTFNKGDFDACGAMWDMTAFTYKVTEKIKASNEMKAGFIKGIKGIGSNLYTRLGSEEGATGSYHMLRVVDSPDGIGVMFRVVGKNGLNYHRYLLENIDGKTCAIDMYIFATGENLTETMRRLYIAGVSQTDTSGLVLFQQMQKDITAEKWQDALDTFDKLPDELKQTKLTHIMCIKATAHISDALYDKELADYSKMFNNDGTLNMLIMDRYFIAKDFVKYDRAVDDLDRSVGGDEYLNLFRANRWYASGQKDKCLKIAEDTLKREPTLLPLADLVLTIALKDGDNQLAKQTMLTMEQNTDFRFRDLKGLGMYKNFVESPEYQEWMKERPSAQK